MPPRVKELRLHQSVRRNSGRCRLHGGVFGLGTICVYVSAIPEIGAHYINRRPIPHSTHRVAAQTSEMIEGDDVRSWSMFANTGKNQIDDTLYGAWMKKYRLVVRTLGKVYEGDSEREAKRRYRLFVKGLSSPSGGRLDRR